MESVGSMGPPRGREEGKESGAMLGTRPQSKQPSGSQAQVVTSSEEYEIVRDKDPERKSTKIPDGHPRGP